MRPVVDEIQRPLGFKSAYYAHGHAHVAPVGKLPWICTSTGQDGSSEVNF